MSDSPQTASPPPAADAPGLEGYQERYRRYRAEGLDHNAAQRAASSKGAGASPGASDRPPRRARGGRGTGTPKGGGRVPTLARTVRELASTLGGTVAIFDEYTGAVLIDNAASLGTAVAKAADHNPRLRRAAEGFAAGGVYGSLMVVSLSIVVPIAARWGLIPEPHGSRLAMLLAPESVRERMATAPATNGVPA